MAKNLFNKAKAAPGATASKAQKEEIVIKEPMFHQMLSRLADVNQEMDELKAEGGVLAAEVKARGISEMQKLYEENLRFPGSFQIKAVAEGQNDASLLFITQDKYIKIDEERSEELSKKYGESIVDEETTFIMDSKLIEKYGEVISNMIMDCKEIEESDKEKLISAKVDYKIKKGTIQDLKTKYNAKPLAEVIEDIKPVYQLKGIRTDD
jgi:hypothetical protein